MDITYTVTEDMIKPSASPSPTPTAKPVTSPTPIKDIPKTGDENNIVLYGLIAASALLGAIGIYSKIRKDTYD